MSGFQIPATKRRGGLLNAKGNWLVLDEEGIQRPDMTWQHKCGATIQTARVHHPIHDGPFPLSGGGRVQVEEIPYCPRCELTPDWQGLPITP